MRAGCSASAAPWNPAELENPKEKSGDFHATLRVGTPWPPRWPPLMGTHWPPFMIRWVGHWVLFSCVCCHHPRYHRMIFPGIIPADVFNGLVDDDILMDFPDIMGATSPVANAPHFSVGDEDGLTKVRDAGWATPLLCCACYLLEASYVIRLLAGSSVWLLKRFLANSFD